MGELPKFATREEIAINFMDEVVRVAVGFKNNCYANGYVEAVSEPHTMKMTVYGMPMEIRFIYKKQDSANGENND